MPSDVFRPRLPLDPFANIHHNVPWRIPAHLDHSPPQVIFILGGKRLLFCLFVCPAEHPTEPLLTDLLPLLHSPHLAQSLLLIATHAPLALPTTTRGQGPAVRVLRLAAPLHVHDTGALRLVSLFERAQRVAVLWRSHRGNTTPHVLHLAEDGPNGEFAIVDTSSAAEKYPSPASSFVSVKRATSIKNRLSMLSESLQSSSRSSVVSLTSSPKKARRSLIIDTFSQLTKFDGNTAGSSPSSPSSHSRSFDAIVNFLPSGLPDKALFKHSILVTTLSAQYLALPFAGADTHTHGPGSYSGAGAEQQHAYHYQRRSSSPPQLPIASPTPLSLSHLPSFASSSSASASSSSASSSASLSLSTPPKAKTNDPIRQRHHRRFSSFALASHASSSSTPDASGASGDESPALRPEWRSGSSYGLSSASASGASTAVTTPATSPGWELSCDDDDDECEDDDVAQKMSRRKSMKKRLSSLFASVSRPVSISSAAELGTEMEMGLLGASADADAKRRARPQNAHIVHVLPADWTPPPPAPPPANANAAAAASPYAKARAPANTHPKPPAKPKLVQGIEQFLLGFAYPLAGLSDQSAPPASRPRRGGAPPPSAYNQPSNSYNRRPQSWGSVASAGGGAGGGGQLASLLGEKGDESFKARAVPYLVAPGLFGRTLGNGKGKGKEGEWGGNTLYEYEEEEEEEEADVEDVEDSVEELAHDSDAIQTRVRRRRARRSVTLGEAVLLGALDLDADTAADASGNRAAVGCGRAWIAEGDVELVGSDAGVVEVRRSRTVRRKEKSKDVEVDVDVAKEMLENAKEKDAEKEKENAKEDSTTSLGLPTPPRSQRSSVTSSSAGHSDSAEGEGGSASGSGSGELTRSNSSGSCSEAVHHQSEDVDADDASQVQVQVQAARNTVTMTSARASVIAIPPRAAPRRESSESASSVLALAPASGSGSTSTSKAVVGGVPMSRSPSSSGMKAPHYVPVRLLAQQQAKEAGVEVSVTLPRAVHLLGSGGASQDSTIPARITARAAVEVDSGRTVDADGVSLSRPGPGSVPSANPTSTVVAPAPEAQAKSKSKKLSLKLKAPALLREQTKAKITKERPASMVVLGDRSHAHVKAAAVEGEGGRERKRSSYGVLFLGSALRRVTQGLGSSVFGARAGSAAGGEKE
ncbi:hypothetical protein CVT25_006844 [Psilocybe cyanescens]|uniref:Uncharacterized protein n=1 Tax=Psilocybe cyanescens TaxID=93625 RepID=A0A409X794_PSICY|nr:hypothetical protein CVT25_006844 [Psilocybe cyanescens]